MAALAPPYLPRQPTQTVLHRIVRENLESFLAYTREHYEGGLPRYVEKELRAYLACGDFSQGFTRARCDACGHDLLIAFSCKTRTVCPSCTGRRMANTAASIVDRVLPDVPVRQYVLTFPYELRKLVAFKADVLTAMGKLASEAILVRYKRCAQRDGLEDEVRCGSINFVQRFGSLNLHVHFHMVLPDGVFTRDKEGRVWFHAAPAPTREELDAIVERIEDRATAWLRRHGYLDERPLADRSNEPPAQTALDACAAIAMGRGNVATLPNAEAEDPDHESAPDKPAVAVDRGGFNLHAGVRIEAGDDLGRERLARYGARPPLSLERLRRLPGGRVAYRLKYVTRGRGKFRVMSGLEFMARLSAIVAPPRYPLVRFAGVFGPRNSWRKDVVPKPRDRPHACEGAPDAKGATPAPSKSRETTGYTNAHVTPSDATPPSFGLPAATSTGITGRSADCAPAKTDADVVDAVRVPSDSVAQPAVHVEREPLRARAVPRVATRSGDVIALAPNVLAVRHWDRLLGGLLYAATPRVSWANLLRRSFDVDALECPKCHGRIRVLAVITECPQITRVLEHLGLPTEAMPLARARDPTEDEYAEDAGAPPDQLGLELA